MKRFVLIIFMALVGVSGFAQSGTCGDNLTWALADGTLTIRGTGAMPDYEAGDTHLPWHTYREDITSVVVGPGMKNIGNYAFSRCGNWVSIAIPASVTSIGVFAFYWCGSLADVTVNWTTTPPAINSNVFDDLTLNDITLHVPAGTKAVYEAAEVWKEFTIVERPPVGIPTLSQAGGWKAYVSNGVLYVNGLAAGEVWGVYDIAGKRVYHGDATRVPLAVRGVYIVRTETRSVKVGY
jgi:hypothetical protein